MNQDGDTTADAVLAACSALCHGDRAKVFQTLLLAVARLCASSAGCDALMRVAIDSLEAGRVAGLKAREEMVMLAEDVS